MTQPSQGAMDAINAETLRRYGNGEPYIPEENIEDALTFSHSLREQAESIATAVATLAKASTWGTPHANIVVAELITLHSVELDNVAMRVAEAVAEKDPGRFDGRFTDKLQDLADRFRIRQMNG